MLSERLMSLREGLLVASLSGRVDGRLAALAEAELDTAIEEARAMEAQPVPLCSRLTSQHLADGKLSQWPVAPRREGGR